MCLRCLLIGDLLPLLVSEKSRLVDPWCPSSLFWSFVMLFLLLCILRLMLRLNTVAMCQSVLDNLPIWEWDARCNAVCALPS